MLLGLVVLLGVSAALAYVAVAFALAEWVADHFNETWGTIALAWCLLGPPLAVAAFFVGG